MRLEELATPAALVELPTLERNAAVMRERANRLGVRLRPHVKTHKCVAAALVQHGGRPGPVTVSTLAEARALAAAGFDDLLLAVPIAPARLLPALELGRRVRLGVLLDDCATVAEAERAAAAAGVGLPVHVEVDSGHHRTGVDPGSAQAVEVAAAVAAAPHLELAGILTHAGQAYSCRDRGEALEVACHERDTMVRVAARLREAGLPVTGVSVGSTPTVRAVDSLAGVTEVRPGNYVFFDAFQAAIGSCQPGDCAFSVLATVIGCYPGAGRLVVDAGALALSKDPGPTHVDPGCGFGLVLPPAAVAGRARLRVVSLSQEHGVLAVDPPPLAAALPVGSRVRVVPNHSCLAAACFDRYAVVAGGRVVDEWRPVRGW